MKARVLAADSRGVRSLALYVEMCGLSIAVDLGASLAPRRYGLPPHEIEVEVLERALDRIRGFLSQSHVAIITHYHYDHYMAGEPELYYGKKLFVKNPREAINRSQKLRAHKFLVRGSVEEKASVVYADGSVYEYEGVKFRFSPPVWHGKPGTRVGWVVMALMECDEGRVVYGSDVQGPVDDDAVDWLISLKRPDLLVIDGPPTYFAGYKVPLEAVEKGFEGLVRVLRSLRPRKAIVDHHLARDMRYEEILSDLRGRIGSSVQILSAAEYEGLPLMLLEAHRRELWRGEWRPSLAP